jgi:hypothetical protein
VRAGSRYHQAARELHGSRQLTGAVTVVHFEHAVDDVPELTVCRRPGTPWVTGRARPAHHDEVKRVTAAALSLFGTH